MTYTRGALVEEKEPDVKLRRPVDRQRELQLDLPTIQLDPKGSKIKYFVGSSTGTTTLGVPIPHHENNRTQDVINLENDGAKPIIIQCGHFYADSMKRKNRNRKHGNYDTHTRLMWEKQ